MHGSTEIPLVRLSLLLPLVDGLERLGVDPWSWAPLASAATAAATVGDFLLRFSLAASEDASSITYTLETAGRRWATPGRAAGWWRGCVIPR